MKAFFVLIAALLIASPASAHITLETKESASGAGYKGVLKVPHGCKGSATTRITVQIPEGVIAVKPMPKPGWKLETVKGKYAKTYDFMHGMKMSDGVQTITWTGKLEDEFYDEFVFAGWVASAVAPGTVLAFPVIQTCEQGEEKWMEIPAAGQDPHSLKSPAPLLKVTGKAKASSPATSFTSGSITVEKPWLREMPSGAKVAGGYLSITNSGTAADKLLGGTLEGASRLEIHEMSKDNGLMRMRQLKDGLEIKPGETVELSPGGYHLMGMDVTAPFKAGQTVKGTLQFQKAGSVAVEFTVQPMSGPKEDHSGH